MPNWIYKMEKAGLLLSLCLWLTSTSAAELVITRPPRNATVLLHTGFLLHCEASGDPKPQVKWYHNDNEMVRTGQNYKVRSSGTLRFKAIAVQDRGIYRCKVESGREILYSDPAHVVVQAQVDFVNFDPKRDIRLPYKGTGIFICQVAGIPPPVIQWRKDGESIINPADYGITIEEKPEQDGIVLKSKLTAPNMTSSATFECEAHNEHIGGITVKTKYFRVGVLPPEGK